MKFQWRFPLIVLLLWEVCGEKQGKKKSWEKKWVKSEKIMFAIIVLKIFFPLTINLASKKKTSKLCRFFFAAIALLTVWHEFDTTARHQVWFVGIATRVLDFSSVDIHHIALSPLVSSPHSAILCDMETLWCAGVGIEPNCVCCLLPFFSRWLPIKAWASVARTTQT